MLKTLRNNQSKQYHLVKDKLKPRERKSESLVPTLALECQAPELSLEFISLHQLVKRGDLGLKAEPCQGAFELPLSQTRASASLLLLNDLPWEVTVLLK